MLNKDNIRELAYLVRIGGISPIEGADRVEIAYVGGWTIMVRKGQFSVGDIAIYFEIDSKVPETEAFEFLAAKHYKVKTQKYFKGTVISQGLLMSPSDFGWTASQYGVNINGVEHFVDNETRFLTKELGVVYSVDEDNKRKANSVDKYRRMAQRNGKLFAHQPFRWLMRRTWGKKLLFIFFGRRGDKKSGWPVWVKKTDEERVQNMPWILQDKSPWVVTEKIDGTSTTFTMKRKKFRKNEFYVCSRNVVFDKPDKNCYYDTNVYLEMAQKYNVEKVLEDILIKCPDLEWVTLQGETYGEGIQKRTYSNLGHSFMGFNFITSAEGRWDTVRAAKLFNDYGIPWVPVIDENYILPDTVEELLTYATGESTLDTGLREGFVFRSQDGTQSFKAVSNEFLMKFHQ